MFIYFSNAYRYILPPVIAKQTVDYLDLAMNLTIGQNGEFVPQIEARRYLDADW